MRTFEFNIKDFYEVDDLLEKYKKHYPGTRIYVFKPTQTESSQGKGYIRFYQGDEKQFESFIENTPWQVLGIEKPTEVFNRSSSEVEVEIVPLGLMSIHT